MRSVTVHISETSCYHKKTTQNKVFNVSVYWHIETRYELCCHCHRSLLHNGD